MDLDRFFASYIDCALWASNDDDGEPIGEENVSRLAPETVAKMEQDCADFIAQNSEDLDASGLSSDRCGFDFWLTRNHHGSGFWDEYWNGSEEEKACDRLTAAADDCGPADIYFGDDGLLYLA